MPRNLQTVLKNFSRINDNIYIKPGDVIGSKDKENSVLARATVDVTFTREVPIYNLTEFCNVMDLFGEPELELLDSFLYIKGPNSRQKFAYSKPDLLVYPENFPPNRDPEAAFNLSKEDYVKIKKAATVNKFNSIVIVGSDGKIAIETTDIDGEGRRTENSNFFRIDLGQETDREFEIIMNMAFFQPIEDTYTVEINMNKKIRYVKMHNDTLEYWIAMNKHSSMVERGE